MCDSAASRSMRGLTRASTAAARGRRAVPAEQAGPNVHLAFGERMCSVQASHDPDDLAMSRRSSRPRGTGELFTKANTWYGRWYVRGKPVKRSLGPVRQPGTRIGLTRTMAENKLREQM